MKTLRRLTLLLVFALVIFVLGGCSGPMGPQGAAGTNVSGATVNNTGHLILTLSNGQTIDAGSVVGPQGPAATSFAGVVPQAEPTIVRIDVTQANGGDSGSGTIIDKRGYIITNAHVINGGQSIKVTLKDGTVLPATVVGSDTTQDMAILQLTTTQTDFPTMPLGTMEDVMVGEDVMVMGFPLGTSLSGPATFTKGVVSAIRTESGKTYIQTDTPINPGNSGGCMFTLSGKMIGIPTADVAPTNQDFENIGIAIPINQISAFIAQYVK